MDLNLVRVFIAVYETGSLTLAGERLFVTQSAISQSLGKLRARFDDPLFERRGREMQPTPLADQLFPSFRNALGTIDRAVDDVHGFNAQSSERVFRIALSELGEIGWLPAIYRAVAERAPRVRLEVVSIAPDNLNGWLNRGNVDVAITPADVPGLFERIHIKWENYAVIMSKQSSLPHGPITAENYQSSLRVVVEGDTAATLIEAAQRRAGIVVSPTVVVQHFATLPQLISENPQLIALVPGSIAEGWATHWPLRIEEPPYVVPTVELNLYRRQSSENTAALDWLFNTIGEAVSGHAGDFASIRGSQVTQVSFSG
jgi:DNA-binding transcriptional LysR family regulator